MTNTQRNPPRRRARLEFVSDAVQRHQDQAALAIASARTKLLRYADRAVETLSELLEYSDNDRVKLAAAEAILDRTGLGKQSTTTVQVDQGEHDAAKADAQDLVARIARNKAALETTAHEVPLDTLIVLEGETAS